MLAVREARPSQSDGGQGPPLVLLPGWGARSSWWEPMLAALPEPGRRAVLIDLLGHGGSAAPRDGYSVEHQAELVARELEERDMPPAIMIGHSLGGLILVALAAREPERFAGLVLLDTPPNLRDRRFSLLARFSLLPVVGAVTWRFAPDAVFALGLRLVVARGFSVPRQLVRESRAMSHRSARLAAAGVDEFLKKVDVIDVLRELDKPTLVLWGEEDHYLLPVAAREYEPVASVVTIPGAGHTPYVEKPDRVALEVERFAAQLPVRTAP